jgi:tetratricopeptide (TPR) repeat protein
MLSPSLLKKIQAKMDRGDELLDRDQFAKAQEAFRQAVALIPSPKYRHEISLPAYTALGEGYLFAGYHERALRAFQQALKAPGGVESPLLYLRIGQAYFEIRDYDRAADELTRAYALDGRDVFDGEDDKYLSFLATRIKL